MPAQAPLTEQLKYICPLHYDDPGCRDKHRLVMATSALRQCSIGSDMDLDRCAAVIFVVSDDGNNCDSMLKRKNFRGHSRFFCLAAAGVAQPGHGRFHIHKVESST